MVYGVDVTTADQPAAPGQWRFAPPSPQLVPVANPAAGAQWSWTSPLEYLVQLTAVTFRLVTSATAGTRQVAVKVAGPDTNLVTFTPVVGTVTATKTATASFWPNAPVVALPISHLTAPCPRITFPPGSVISSTVVTLKTTDQLSRVVLTVRLI